ncbi:olfactory receptor-like protein OLF3 [Mustela erminea]|uniref:olfactory receptor-like protein OLF3 n=1 Tax=Mustela erminea TaxID=36723 RepID=UPI001386E1F0|nr:olfactory receptor-like protein OLF3 [Mustela erminea]
MPRFLRCRFGGHLRKVVDLETPGQFPHQDLSGAGGCVPSPSGGASSRKPEVLERRYVSFFSLVYLAALVANLLIITLTNTDQHLQTPMYFFLKNFSLIDICYISVTVPKYIINSLTDSHSISFVVCASQVFLVVSFAGTEFALPLVMSYDCYAAICCPLHYEAIMNRGACMQMTASVTALADSLFKPAFYCLLLTQSPRMKVALVFHMKEEALKRGAALECQPIQGPDVCGMVEFSMSEHVDEDRQVMLNVNFAYLIDISSEPWTTPPQKNAMDHKG